jgi:predicted AAA+ superfamily ATPase
MSITDQHLRAHSLLKTSINNKISTRSPNISIKATNNKIRLINNKVSQNNLKITRLTLASTIP